MVGHTSVVGNTEVADPFVTSQMSAIQGQTFFKKKKKGKKEEQKNKKQNSWILENTDTK